MLPFHRLVWLLLFALCCSHAVAAAALTIRSERTDPTDLEVCGLLEGLRAGQSGFVSWSELRALPTQELALKGEFVPGEQKVTVVFLQDLLAALPVGKNADVLLASCKDGYASVFTWSFVNAYRPFLILEINGAGPQKWPPRGLSFDPGPYVISYAPGLVPELPALLDAGHKKPWGVSRIEIAQLSDRFAGAFTGRWSHLSTRAQAGREIWINACACCHVGPIGIFGGTKSDRPFAVVAGYAETNPVYFKRYVREPQAINAGAKMEGHPHYTDAHLDDLIAFILAEAEKR